MAKTSAGILPFRRRGDAIDVFLVHPGGPYFAKRDAGWWTVPKGLVEAGEDPLAAAQRELVEETGFPLPDGPWLPLGEIVQKGGKRVEAWAVEAPSFDPGALASDTFEIEWPPRSGKRASFPEVDRAAWLDDAAARELMMPAQHPFLDRLLSSVSK